jgi:hypothetical protein
VYERNEFGTLAPERRDGGRPIRPHVRYKEIGNVFLGAQHIGYLTHAATEAEPSNRGSCYAGANLTGILPPKAAKSARFKRKNQFSHQFLWHRDKGAHLATQQEGHAFRVVLQPVLSVSKLDPINSCRHASPGSENQARDIEEQPQAHTFYRQNDKPPSPINVNPRRIQLLSFSSPGK